MKRILSLITTILAAVFFLTACISVPSRLQPGVTPPPPLTEAPSEQPTDAPEASAEPSGTPGEGGDEILDALGNPIYTADHYERYISFSGIRIYEENGETLIDCTVTNSYPELMLLAVNITFFNDDGDEIASGSLQMPDGSFLLALEPGDTPLYARILTDIVLTDKTFKLSYDGHTGVKPQK